MAFVGLNDSWEQFYQATRRLWRFGQTKPVECHIIIEEREGSVLKNIKRKDEQAKYMIKNMIQETSDFTKLEIQNKIKVNKKLKIKMKLPQWIN